MSKIYGKPPTDELNQPLLLDRGSAKGFTAFLAHTAKQELTPFQIAVAEAVVHGGSVLIRSTPTGFEIVPQEDIRGARPDIALLDDIVNIGGGASVQTFCGNPLDNVGVSPYPKETKLDDRFNSEPEKSTFTPKIHRKTKRW